MKRQTIILVSAALAVGVSCTDLTEVNERLASLEDRISAVEAVLPTLNENIASLRTLAGGGTVNKVEFSDGVYTVTLSNGSVLTLNQGSIGVGKAPVMSISSDGYWMVDCQDGQGARYVMNGTQKVPALGQDGVTPVFGVDKDGNWTVSYDGGKTFSAVKDADGNTVRAVADEGSSDSYFAGVEVKDDVLTLTLRNGQVYRLPVVSDFLFSVKGAEDIQLFEPDETKSFEVEMKGVCETAFYKPQGWEVSLSEKLLTVKAPASAGSTKSTIADSRSDVSVLAVSSQGYSCIAKVRVQLSGTDLEVNPAASVSVDTVTFNSARFKVVVEDVTSWKYIFAKTAAAAPDTATLRTQGTVGTDQTLTFESLDPKTSYTLYVLPVNDRKNGAIAKASVTTPAEPAQTYTDNLTAWNSGKAIFIAGEKYTKAEWGDAMVLTAESADTPISCLTPGVYVLDCNPGCNFVMEHTTDGYVVDGDIVVIGRYPASRPSVKFKGWAQFKGSFSILDVKLDCSVNSKNYVFTYGADAEKFHVDGCAITAFNSNQTAYCANHIPASIRIVNSDVRYNAAQGAGLLGLSFSSSKKLYSLKEVTVENNIFYNPNYAYYLIAGCNSNAKLSEQTGSYQGTTISICSNTFYNLTSNSGTGCLVYAADASVITVDKNIFWTSCAAGTHRCVRLLSGTEPSAATYGSNVCFGLGYASAWRYFYDLTTNTIPRVTETPLATADPSTMTFTPTEEYSGYGAQRN